MYDLLHGTKLLKHVFLIWVLDSYMYVYVHILCLSIYRHVSCFYIFPIQNFEPNAKQQKIIHGLTSMPWICVIILDDFQATSSPRQFHGARSVGVRVAGQRL